jgi:hypothetical protein
MHGDAFSVTVFHCLSTPTGITILLQLREGILQAFDGMDVAAIKSPNRIVLDGMFFPVSCLVGIQSTTRSGFERMFIKKSLGLRTPTGDPINSDRFQTDDPRFHRHRFEPIRR